MCEKQIHGLAFSFINFLRTLLFILFHCMLSGGGSIQPVKGYFLCFHEQLFRMFGLSCSSFMYEEF